ncbi:protein-disulfide reductase DsbD family protein [Vibrio algivorus]|uniref:Thiol:disulfide interchange protein DsbD n=1 Tax=Vibrio algivorus TaxID=1667024 RepID=A0ABQ6EP80_9VIBR|nr:protein-disulfide reductase DsbD domain-containing protein [Vibrio algivorus]GLT14774.1 thiol:disulfide interchange protein DsbD [Vibrio algivorus]
MQFFTVFICFQPKLSRLSAWLLGLCALFSAHLMAAPPTTGWIKAEQHPPVEVQFVLTGQVDENNNAAGFIEVKLADEWKTYWRSPGEGGVSPELNWQASSNINQVDWHWPYPQRFDVLGIETLGYKHDVVFPLSIKIANRHQPATFKANLSLSSCSTVCVITDYPLELNFTASELKAEPDAMRRYAQAMSLVPQGSSMLTETQAKWDAASNKLQVSLTSQQGWQQPDLFIDGKAEKVADSSFSHPRLSIDGNQLTAWFDVSNWLGEPDLSGESIQITIVGKQFIAEQTIALTDGSVSEASTGSSLLTMFAFALLGGLILNVMPCVLPVLGMKLTSVLSAERQQKSQIRMQFLASAAGIISSFWLIAASLAILKWSGQSIGWGIQFQSAGFLGLMVLVTAIFGTNMLGLFELRLPSSVNTWMATKGSNKHSGHFMQGMFATLLATPCSAPFLGTAVAFALGASWATLFLIFTGLGIGMALPWLLVALRPSLALKLPKPGKWMNRLKNLFGLMMLSTCVWLISLLSSHLSAGLLWAISVLGSLLLIWRSVQVFGGRSVAITSCIALIASSVIFFIASLTADYWRSPLPAELSWQPLDTQTIKQQVAIGNTVFVDVTADWCITCKANKIGVLLQQPVYDALQQDKVIRMQGDWTVPNPQVSEYLQSYNRFGVPFNIVYGPQAPRGIALPVIYSSDDVMQALAQASGGAQ